MTDVPPGADTASPYVGGRLFACGREALCVSNGFPAQPAQPSQQHEDH